MKNPFDLKTLVRPNIAKLKPYSSARDEFDGEATDMIFLDANENPFDNGFNRYPDPHQEKLKKKISELKQINPENILLGNGSDEVLDLIFRAFCEPGKDSVVVLPPTYGMYQVLADINNIEVKEILLNQDFQPNTQEIFSKVDSQTKMLFLCSPNNPTGNLISENIIHEILTNFPGIVIIDEAYIDFCEQESWSKKLDQYPNLIITQTLSKAYGMAGLRLGIAFASIEILDILKRIKPPYNINVLSQKQALTQLEKSEMLSYQLFDIQENKSTLTQQLLQLEFVKNIIPSDANFLLIEVDDAKLRYNQLLKKGIVVRNRSNQPLCENSIRISVGTKEETEELISVLKNLN